MFENILTGLFFGATTLVFGAITLAVIILLSWVGVYAILDIISQLKNFKKGDN